jgi:hypothetical protein
VRGLEQLIDAASVQLAGEDHLVFYEEETLQRSSEKAQYEENFRGR